MTDKKKSRFADRRRYTLINGIELTEVTKEDMEELFKPKKTFQLDLLMWILLGMIVGTIIARVAS